ncbi:hypothetical protein JW926_16795 [Candidatus Sumerlaeota bacterium]|nr:hypothetical protein [Candidatus Sumerlaeota bacterium]
MIKFSDRLLKIDRRIIYSLLAIAIIIPIFFPLNLPVKITDEVRGVYNEIDNLPPGSKVLVVYDYEPASRPEVDPMALAVMRHCVRKDLKVVGISYLELGRGNGENIFNMIQSEFEEKGKHLVYGEDLAYMGFKPGRSAMILNLGKDFKGTCVTDYRGNDAYSMPILEDIEGLGDFEYLVCLHDDSSVSIWILYGFEIVGIKIGACCTAVMAPGIYANLDAGQLTGIVGGLKGGSEYEKLLNYRGMATSGMDSQTVIHILIVIFILIGNFSYLAKEHYLKKEQMR